MKRPAAKPKPEPQPVTVITWLQEAFNAEEAARELASFRDDTGNKGKYAGLESGAIRLLTDGETVADGCGSSVVECGIVGPLA